MESEERRMEGSGENAVNPALIGGSAGAIAGMMCFRHKIRKAKFMITVPVIFVVEVILLIIWLL